MKPKQAKEIAEELGANFWWDKHLKLWCTTDPKNFGGSDYMASCHLRDFNETGFRQWIQITVDQWKEAEEARPCY